MNKYLQEKHLFPPLKKYFNGLGYKVFAEVPSYYRCIDFVAVKEHEHIAVEMKLSFTKEAVRQAQTNAPFFHESYVAVPTNPRKDSESIGWCHRWGVGVLRVFPLGTIFTMIEAQKRIPGREFDFSTFEESANDEAGLPFQRGKSMAFTVLDRIKKYVTEHPTADWKEIFLNVQSHYSSHASLSGSMGQWKRFSLSEFKKSMYNKVNEPQQSINRTIASDRKQP